jgi:selenium metabolism protein YedF
MSEKIIDARGLACPKPVLLTREALAAGNADEVRVIIDNLASCENVTRMANSMGCQARIDRQAAGEIHLLVRVASQANASACPQASRTVVLVSSDRFGEGDDDLGMILMRAFIKTLKEVAPPPASLLLVNAGVKLAVEESSLLSDIRELEAAGVQVLSCGTCLDFFHLKEKLAIGKITNMFEVVSQLSAAERVLRP